MSHKTYRIGEAAAKLNLKSYVLRFWETEFPQIAPLRTEKGQRLYTESDLAVLDRIRYLLHERGLTIDGARKMLRYAAAKGPLHTGADIPANIDPIYDADGFDDEAQAEDIRIPEKTAAHVPAAYGSAAKIPEQSSLFPPKTEASAMNLTELRGIVAELEAIHRLLVNDGEK